MTPIQWIEQVLPFIRVQKSKLGGPNWKMFVEEAYAIFDRHREIHADKWHPAMLQAVIDGDVPLSDAIQFTKLEFEQQVDIAERIKTITVEEYRGFLKHCESM